MKKTSKKRLVFFLLFSLIVLPLAVNAQNMIGDQWGDVINNWQDNRQESDDYLPVRVPETETVNDNYFRVADSITIDGNVNGDAIVVAGEVIINGDVSGDVLALAGRLEINGEVSGNVRVIAGEVKLNGSVGKNASLAVGRATLTDLAKIGWSLAFGAGEITINSPVAGNIYGYGGLVNLNSEVGTNATIFLDQNSQVSLGDKALIYGQLTYYAEKSASVSPQAVVKGETIKKNPPERFFAARQFLSQAWIYGKIISWLSLLLVGTIIISLFHKKAKYLATAMWEKPGLKMIWGFIFLFSVPIAAIILALTIIGLPLAIIAMAGYLLLTYLTKIFIGLMIGMKILNKNTAGKETSGIWQMMFGVTIFYILSHLPYFGWIVGFVGMIWFLGTVWELTYNHLKNKQVKKDEPVKS